MAVYNEGKPEYPWQYSEKQKHEYIQEHGKEVWEAFVKRSLKDPEVQRVRDYSRNYDKISSEEKSDLIERVRRIHPEKSSSERVMIVGRIMKGRHQDGYNPNLN